MRQPEPRCLASTPLACVHDRMGDTQPDLSVVLAASGDASALDAALTALSEGCDGVSTELIVVRAEGRPTAGGEQRPVSAAQFVALPGTALVPQLWGAGARLATGTVVAFTTDQMRVCPGWGRSLHQAVTSGSVGAGGPIDLTKRAAPTTAAVYFARFSGFIPGAVPVGAAVHDVAGDNAAYGRAALLQHADLLADGFWEVEFHRRFERDGEVLRMAAAHARFVGPTHFADSLWRRYQHGREFGRVRVHSHGASRPGILLRAPLVPFVLIGRVARRVYLAQRHRAQLVISLPWLALLCIAWASGEATGAVIGRTKRTV